MVETAELKALEERIKTTKARYGRVFTYRLRLIKDIQKIQREVIKHIVNALEHDLDEATFQTGLQSLKTSTQQLLEKTTRSERTLDVLLKVIRHPRHLPLILNYFDQIPRKERGDFEHAINSIRSIFQDLERLLQNQLLPIVKRQSQYLEYFIKTQNVTYLIEYITLFRQEQKLIDEFGKRIHKYVSFLKGSWGKVAEILKAPAKFSDAHKRAATLMWLGLALAGIVLSFCPATGGLFVFFGIARSIGSGIWKLRSFSNAFQTLTTA